LIPAVTAASLGVSNQTRSGVVNDDVAKDLLRRYLERGRNVNMSAIVEQMQFGRGSRTMQVKIEQDRAGRRRITVLHPLSMQGVWSVDDGKKWTHYYPDEGKMVIQDSPPERRDRVRDRLAMAEQNYTFALEKSPSIASRKAAVVVAVPRVPEMPARRYSIELTKAVLLKLETVHPDGERKVLMDTKAIDFPSSLPSSTFQIKPVGTVEVITAPAPIKLESAAAAKAAAGFEPVIPAQLPFGFVVRDKELTGKEGSRMIAVRLTDGLVYATAYQFLEGSGRESGRFKGRGEQSVNGLRIRLAGDLPQSVHKGLLETFLREAARTMRPPSEPSTRAPALNFSQARAAPANAAGRGRRPPDGPEGRCEAQCGLEFFWIVVWDDVPACETILE